MFPRISPCDNFAHTFLIESFEAGIALEVGIGPTVRQALDLNYVPIVVSDACGAKTAQNKDRVLTEFADTGEVIVVDTNILLPRLV